MQVKGTGIKTTRDFVKYNHPHKFQQWLNALPDDSKKLYSGVLDVGGWFDIDAAYYTPIDKIVEVLYHGNATKAGDELGRYSAETALKGIYKVFLLVATPQYLMKRAANMMRAFYSPSEIEVTESSKKQVVVKITHFKGITKATEYRVAGWCAKALELCNCQNVSYKINEQLSAGQPITSIVFDWD